MFNYLVVLSLVFGLINCQYGGTPQLRKGNVKTLFRDEFPTTTTTTVAPEETFFGQDSYDDTDSQVDTSFGTGYGMQTPVVNQQPFVQQPVQQPVHRPAFQQPLGGSSSGYASQQTISRKTQPISREQTIEKPVVPTYGGAQPTISRDRPVVEKPVVPTYGGAQPTISRDKPVAPAVAREQPVVPTYGGSQPTISRERPIPVQRPTQKVVQRPVQTLVKDRPVQRPTNMGRDKVTQGGAYGSTLVISKPQRDEVVVPGTDSFGSDSQFGLPESTTGGKVTGGCKANPCLNEATCIDVGNNGFRCECPWGWVGARCEICITECASNPCPSNKKCRAKYGGGYECICPADRTGMNCEIQNDACANQPCLNGGECSALTNGDFQCTCVEPFAGKSCEKQWNNPCTEEVLRNVDTIQFEYPWDRTKYIICTDINQWVAMPCSPKTRFESTLGHCVPEGYEPPVCPPNFCLNDGECAADELTGDLTCKCKSGFTGVNCETNIDECELYGNPCGTGICHDQINTYFCECPNGGIGLDCRFTIPNPCTDEEVEADRTFFTVLSADGDHYLRCTGLGTFTVNRCAKGLFWNMEERTCTLDKPSELTGACAAAPCKNGGNCVDLGSSQFRCMCKEGYTGELCEEMIDFCASNPCMNGGRCLPYAGGYTCVCPDKIIDDCCCTGVINPCPEKSKLIPGVNNYYEHLFPTKYIHCDFDGRAFVRNCAHGTKWRQEVLSCLSDDVVLNNTFTPTTGGQLSAPLAGQFGGSSDSSYGKLPQLSQPTNVRKGQQMPMQREQTVQQTYEQPKPVVQKPQVPSKMTLVQKPAGISKMQRPVQKESVVPSVPSQQYGQLPSLTQTGISRVQPIQKEETLKPMPKPTIQERKPLLKEQQTSQYGSLPTIEKPISREQTLDQGYGSEQSFGGADEDQTFYNGDDLESSENTLGESQDNTQDSDAGSDDFGYGQQGYGSQQPVQQGTGRSMGVPQTRVEPAPSMVSPKGRSMGMGVSQTRVEPVPSMVSPQGRSMSSLNIPQSRVEQVQDMSMGMDMGMDMGMTMDMGTQKPSGRSVVSPVNNARVSQVQMPTQQQRVQQSAVQQTMGQRRVVQQPLSVSQSGRTLQQQLRKF